MSRRRSTIAPAVLLASALGAVALGAAPRVSTYIDLEAADIGGHHRRTTAKLVVR